MLANVIKVFFTLFVLVVFVFFPPLLMTLIWSDFTVPLLDGLGIGIVYLALLLTWLLIMAALSMFLFLYDFSVRNIGKG